MSEGITYVGMDAHKKSITVAMLTPGETEPTVWQVKNESKSIRSLARKLKRDAPGEVVSCYEAGPCGYALQRQLEGQSVRCKVIAPSLTPVKPGERIKTDRRDAKKLTVLLRAGLLTEVSPPTSEEEAVRDLCRCREDAKEDLERARHRLSKMLLRRGLVYRDGRNWTRGHRAWLRSIKWDFDADQAVFDDYIYAIEQLEERLAGLTAKVEAEAKQPLYAEPVAQLRCFRGIDTVTAMTIVAELHGFGRFSSPRELMAYLGLVPSENSSGGDERRGRITKAGNGHVRRVLVEAAWHYRHRPAVGVKLRKRREGQDGEVIAIADRAQQRLHRRYWHFVTRGKEINKAITAVARELVGFIWAVLYPRACAPAAVQG
jgi:transposase